MNLCEYWRPSGVKYKKHLAVTAICTEWMFHDYMDNLHQFLKINCTIITKHFIIFYITNIKVNSNTKSKNARNLNCEHKNAKLPLLSCSMLLDKCGILILYFSILLHWCIPRSLISVSNATKTVHSLSFILKCY
jgi:hypothetical protein